MVGDQSQNIHIIMFRSRLFVFLAAGFIAATVIGTLSHECGHYGVARSLGYQHCHIGYNYSNYGTAVAREEAIESQMLLIAGGPVQTLLTGSAGLLLIAFQRKKYKSASTLSLPQWLPVFLALFWSRQVFNFVLAICHLATGRLVIRADEFRLTMLLNWPLWSIMAGTAIAGAAVMWYVCFRIVPRDQRMTFIAAGLTGGLLGAWLWLGVAGPRLMP